MYNPHRNFVEIRKSPEIKFISVKDLCENEQPWEEPHRRLRRNGFYSLHWRYHSENYTLCWVGSGGYEIDLERLTHSAEVLDSIAQIAGKVWATPEVIGDLVFSLDFLLSLQGRYCSGGKDRGPVDVAALLKRGES